MSSQSLLSLLVCAAATVVSHSLLLDVSRLSGVSCPKHAKCRLVRGQFGYMSFPGKGSFDDKTQTYVSGGEDNVWEMSTCYNFDCLVDCDPSCTCETLATQASCPLVKYSDSDDQDDAVADVEGAATLSPPPPDKPQLFERLQDVRFTCPLPRTRCEISGFEGCGGSWPEYNLYNSQTGLWIVEDPVRDPHYIELFGCHAKLGSARCDAGCTCQDLETKSPCYATPAPSPPPVTLPKSNQTVIYTSSGREAKITCPALQARCDRPADARSDFATCGATIYSPETVSTGTEAMRVDHWGEELFHQHPERYTVAFSACYEHFDMECDSRCTCFNARTGQPCVCIDSATGEDCTANTTAPQFLSELESKPSSKRTSPMGLTLVGVVVLASSCGFSMVLRRLGSTRRTMPYVKLPISN